VRYIDIKFSQNTLVYYVNVILTIHVFPIGMYSERLSIIVLLIDKVNLDLTRVPYVFCSTNRYQMRLFIHNTDWSHNGDITSNSRCDNQKNK